MCNDLIKTVALERAQLIEQLKGFLTKWAEDTKEISPHDISCCPFDFLHFLKPGSTTIYGWRAYEIADLEEEISTKLGRKLLERKNNPVMILNKELKGLIK